MSGARIALPRPWRTVAARPRGAPSPRRRRRGLVLAGAAAVVLVAAWYWGRDLSLWSVDSVRVTGATGQDAAQIEAALQRAARGMTMLHVRAGALHDAVARFPIVKALRVHTSFPHGIRIEVVENAPVAALMATGSPVAVTADGALLRDRPTAGLPLVPAHSVPAGPRVTDAQAAGAIALAAAAPAGVRGLIARVRSGGHSGLRADLQGGFQVQFGSRARLRAKWAAALRVMADARAEGATYLDVRFPERPVAGGAFVNPLPAAASSRPPTPTPATPVGGTDPGAAGAAAAQNPPVSGGEPPG